MATIEFLPLLVPKSMLKIPTQSMLQQLIATWFEVNNSTPKFSKEISKYIFYINIDKMGFGLIHIQSHPVTGCPSRNGITHLPHSEYEYLSK
jgi:hypothetical protein